jgi:hypothetical protein
MKSEERILELLSEYLHKTDRILERMEKSDRNVEIMSKAILDHSLKFNQISAEIKRLSEENNKLREDQGIMLRELVSISKRVSNLEG